MLFHAQKVFDGLEWGSLFFRSSKNLIFTHIPLLHQPPLSETSYTSTWDGPFSCLSSCNSMDCAAYSKAGIKGIHKFIPTINWLRPTKDTCIQFSRRSPRSLSLLNCFAKILRNGLNLQSSEIIPAPDFI